MFYRAKSAAASPPLTSTPKTASSLPSGIGFVSDAANGEYEIVSPAVMNPETVLASFLASNLVFAPQPDLVGSFVGTDGIEVTVTTTEANGDSQDATGSSASSSSGGSEEVLRRGPVLITRAIR